MSIKEAIKALDKMRITDCIHEEYAGMGLDSSGRKEITGSIYDLKIQLSPFFAGLEAEDRLRRWSLTIELKDNLREEYEG